MPLGKRGPHKRRDERGGTLLKKRYFTAIGSSNVKMFADRHRHAADELLKNINIDDLE